MKIGKIRRTPTLEFELRLPELDSRRKETDGDLGFSSVTESPAAAASSGDDGHASHPGGGEEEPSSSAL
jgi:hypothetical protein